jgi:beta-N-acetylhexosaminidase
MQMQAIAKQYGLEEALRLSINAGIDILCFSNNIQDSENRTVNRVHAIIRTMVEKGQISRERIDQSYQRIIKLKSRVNYSGEENMLRDLEASRNEADALKREVEQLKQKPPVNPNPPADSTQEEPKSKKKKKKKAK